MMSCAGAFLSSDSLAWSPPWVVGVGDDVDEFLDCMPIIVKRYPSCVQESDLPVPRDGVDEQNDEGVKKVKVAVAALTWVLVDWDLRKFVQMRKFA